MKRTKFSIALIVIFTLISVVSLFLASFGYLSYQSQKDREYEKLQLELKYSIEQLSTAAALPLWNFDIQQINSILDSTMNIQSIYGIVLTTENVTHPQTYARSRDEYWQVIHLIPHDPDRDALIEERLVKRDMNTVGNVKIYATTRFIEERLAHLRFQTLAHIIVIDFLLIVSIYLVIWRTVILPLKVMEEFAVASSGGGVPHPAIEHQFLGELESLRLALVHMTELLASRLADMRQQAEELIVQEKRAKLNELRVNQILTASPVPLDVSSLKTGKYIRVNPAWEHQFQFEEKGIIGKSPSDLGIWHSVDDLHDWLERLNTHGRVNGYEVAFSAQGGQVKNFLLSAEKFLYGTEECILTMSVDVSDLKKLESELLALNASLEQRVQERTHDLDRSNQELVITMATLQRAQEELLHSEKLASLGSLVAGVSHELNTPIGNALLAASSMEEDVSAIRRAFGSGTMKRTDFERTMLRVSEGADLTIRSLRRAVALISSFKQVAVDQASERRREFDLALVINELIDTLRPTIKHVDVSVALDLQSGILMNSYPGPLGQVIINLFNNAVTHAFDGRSSGLIRIVTRQENDDSVQLIVQDNGTGISPSHLGHVFDPFFTTKLGQGGSGLGLSVSHRIVTKVLGGSITVLSEPENGATFSIFMPRQAPDVVT